jgi:hypothetical protein
LKFPDSPRLSVEAKDLICRLLCDVDHRIGSSGADQIKVSICYNEIVLLNVFTSNGMILYIYSYVSLIFLLSFLRPILGLKELSGISFMKWRRHLNLK